MNSNRVGADPPPGSPDWWGCPRGARCEFAHGENDLRGWGKEAHEEELKNERKMKEKQKRDAYLGVLDEADDEAMALLVEDGLRAAKRARLNDLNSEETPRKSVDVMQSTLPVDSFPPDTTSSVPTITNSTITIQEGEANILPVDVVSNDSLSVDWLDILSGDVVTHVDGLIECAEGFGTIRAKNCHLGSSSILFDSTHRHHQYYYEIELVTAGLFQVKNLTFPLMIIIRSVGLINIL